MARSWYCFHTNWFPLVWTEEGLWITCAGYSITSASCKNCKTDRHYFSDVLSLSCRFILGNCRHVNTTEIYISRQVWSSSDFITVLRYCLWGNYELFPHRLGNATSPGVGDLITINPGASEQAHSPKACLFLVRRGGAKRFWTARH